MLQNPNILGRFYQYEEEEEHEIYDGDDDTNKPVEKPTISSTIPHFENQHPPNIPFICQNPLAHGQNLYRYEEEEEEIYDGDYYTNKPVEKQTKSPPIHSYIKMSKFGLERFSHQIILA